MKIDVAGRENSKANWPKPFIEAILFPPEWRWEVMLLQSKVAGAKARYKHGWA